MKWRGGEGEAGSNEEEDEEKEMVVEKNDDVKATFPLSV